MNAKDLNYFKQLLLEKRREAIRMAIALNVAMRFPGNGWKLCRIPDTV